ncbi:hypothetical protein PTKU46_14330 [Paraburkholderia terrae]
MFVLLCASKSRRCAPAPLRERHLLRDAKVLRLKDASAQWRVGLAWQTERDDPVVARFVDYVRAASKHGAVAPVTT